MAMDDSAGARTDNEVDPAIPFSVAEIFELPSPTVLDKPCVPGAFEIVATPVVPDVQLTWVVRSWVVESE
jgi:hypothetical protein